MDVQVAAAFTCDSRHGEVPPPLPASYWDWPLSNLLDERLSPAPYTRAAPRSPPHFPRPATLSPALPLLMRYNVVTSAERAAANAASKRSYVGHVVPALHPLHDLATCFEDLRSGGLPAPGDRFVGYNLAPDAAVSGAPVCDSSGTPLELARQLAGACGRLSKCAGRQLDPLPFEILPGVEAGGVPLSKLGGAKAARLQSPRLSKFDPAITGVNYDAYAPYRAVYGADKYDASGSFERALGRAFPEHPAPKAAPAQPFPRPIPPRHAALSTVYDRHEAEVRGRAAVRYDDVYGADKYGGDYGTGTREVGREARPGCGQWRGSGAAHERAAHWDGRAGDQGVAAQWQGAVARELARELADGSEAFVDTWGHARNRCDTRDNAGRLPPQQFCVRGDTGGGDVAPPCTAVRPALHPISKRLPTNLDIRWATESCETMQPPSPPFAFDPALYALDAACEPAAHDPQPAFQRAVPEAAVSRGRRQVCFDTDAPCFGKVPSAAAFAPRIHVPLLANFGVIEQPAYAHVNLPSRLFDGSSHSDQATVALPVQPVGDPTVAPQPPSVELPLLPPNMCYVNESDVVVQRELGRGSFGMVTYQEVEPFGAVAIKWMHPDRRSSAYLSSLLGEAQVLAELNHPNVLRMYGAVIDSANTPVGFITEYCELGSLASYLHNPAIPALTLRQRLELAIHTARGLACLHDRPDRPLVHFDVKPENLLLVCSGTGVSVKVADFGLSKYKLDTYVKGVDDARGTLPYMAPEVVRAPSTITEAIDVWSFGVVMWEMFTREFPFGQMSIEAIVKGLQAGTLCVDVPNGCEDEWAYIMVECLKLDPCRRPRMSQVLDMLKRVLAQLPP